MSKQDPADQVKFLVSCIGHTSNGRPDFQAVATELGIVSKAAAQKRYERMLKANGVTARPSANNGANNGEEKAAPKTSPAKRKTSGEKKTKKAPAKRVKSDPDGSSDSSPSTKQEEVKEENDQSVISDSAQYDNVYGA